MAKEKVDNKLNVVIGTKAQIEVDAGIPENSIVVVTDEELNADEIAYSVEKNVKEVIEDLEATVGDIESALEAILDYSLGDIENGYEVTINESSFWGYQPNNAYLSYSLDGGINWTDLTGNTLPLTINNVTQIMFKITSLSIGSTRTLQNITDDVMLLSNAGTTSNMVLTKNTTYEVATTSGGAD